MRIFLISGLMAIAFGTASVGAATINIAMHNGATTVNAMTTRPDGSVVVTSTDTWNNPARNGAGGLGTTFTGLALSDAAGAATTATLDVASGFTTFNNNGWGSQTADYVMMEGWYGFSGTESFTVNNLPANFTTNGYTVTIFGDVAAARVMNYTLGGTTQTITDTGIFTGTFSAENSTTFTGLSAASFTINGNATGGRSGINGVIIESIPEPGTTALGLLAAGLLVLRRRR